MQKFIRLTESILQNKQLNPTHKLIIGFLQTYQSTPDGTPTDNYYFDTQLNLSKSLGLSISYLKDAINYLEANSFIYKAPKSQYDGKSQYKNRKAIILVDEHNPIPTDYNTPQLRVRKGKTKISDLSNDILTDDIEPISTEIIENIPVSDCLMTIEEFNRRTSYKITNQNMVPILVKWINDGKYTFEESVLGYNLEPEYIILK